MDTDVETAVAAASDPYVTASDPYVTIGDMEQLLNNFERGEASPPLSGFKSIP